MAGLSFDIGRGSQTVAETSQFNLSPSSGAGGRDALPRVAGRVSVQVMHIIYRADNLFDAHLVKDALEAEDIPAFIAGEYLTGAVGQLPAMDYIAVMVPESSLATARGIVSAVEVRLSEARLAIREDDLSGDPLASPC
jgi:hypothetical protein